MGFACAGGHDPLTGDGGRGSCKGSHKQDTETQKDGIGGRGEREWGKEGCEGRRGGGVWKKDGGSEEGRREGCGMDLVKLYF